MVRVSFVVDCTQLGYNEDNFINISASECISALKELDLFEYDVNKLTRTELEEFENESED